MKRGARKLIPAKKLIRADVSGVKRHDELWFQKSDQSVLRVRTAECLT